MLHGDGARIPLRSTFVHLQIERDHLVYLD
jgi:hypothetical protein